MDILNFYIVLSFLATTMVLCLTLVALVAIVLGRQTDIIKSLIKSLSWPISGFSSLFDQHIQKTKSIINPNSITIVL
jgi:hypothetical protein